MFASTVIIVFFLQFYTEATHYTAAQLEASAQTLIKLAKSGVKSSAKTNQLRITKNKTILTPSDLLRCEEDPLGEATSAL